VFNRTVYMKPNEMETWLWIVVNKLGFGKSLRPNGTYSAMPQFRFSWRRVWRKLSTGLLHRVVWYKLPSPGRHLWNVGKLPPGYTRQQPQMTVIFVLATAETKISLTNFTETSWPVLIRNAICTIPQQVNSAYLAKSCFQAKKLNVYLPCSTHIKS
jgi:hypothetical protein